MEFCLVQPEDTQIYESVSLTDESKNTLSARIPVKVRPKLGSTCPADQNIFCSRLQNCLAQISSPTNEGWEEFMLSLLITPIEYSPPGPERFSVTIAVGSPDASCDDGFFSRLIRFFGGNDMFSLDIKMYFQIENEVEKEVIVPIAINDLIIPPEGVMHDVAMPDVVCSNLLNFLQMAFHANSINGTVSVSLKISDEALSLIHQKSQPDNFSIFGGLLSGQILTDVVLKGSNGNGVNCHKCILAGYSAKLRRLFEDAEDDDDDVEWNGVVDISGITEEGIRAFLKYLYSCDIAEISKSCSVAVEVILSAVVCDIPKLLEAVQQVILAKDETWFSTGNVIDLVQMIRQRPGTRGNPGWDQIEKKMLAILRTKSHEEVYACEEYQELFKNPKEGMEFCHYFIQAKQ